MTVLSASPPCLPLCEKDFKSSPFPKCSMSSGEIILKYTWTGFTQSWKGHGIWHLHSWGLEKSWKLDRFVWVIEKSWNFRVFTKLLLSYGWKVKKSKHAASAAFHSLFSPVLLSILRSWNFLSLSFSVWTLLTYAVEKNWNGKNFNCKKCYFVLTAAKQKLGFLSI